MLYNIAICDDCPLQTEVIQALLDKYQADGTNIELYTHSFSSGNALLEYVDAGHRVDLFLLDILMPEQNGIEFARVLRARGLDVPIIFLTSSADHALEAFEVSAEQYILKPVTESKLFPVLDKLTSASKSENEPIFVLPTQKRIVNVPFASIIYVELVGRALGVNLTGGKTLLGVSIRVPFAEAVAPLLDDERFLHVHKSFVINMAHVAELGRASFTMKNGVQVPVPRHKYSAVKDKYLSWLSGRGAGFMGRA